METGMKTRTLLIGGVAAAGIMASGWALAQTTGSGPGMMQSMMQGMHGQTSHGMHGQMGGGMHGQMGGGMHGQMGGGMHGQMGGGMRGQMEPGRQGPGQAQFEPAQLDSLKTELGITTAQEPAWTKYANAVRDAAPAMRAARAGVDPDVRKLSPSDRFAFVSKIREQAQKQSEAVQAAADELLATLDDAQKAKAEETLPGLAFGPGAMRGASMAGPRYRH